MTKKEGNLVVVYGYMKWNSVVMNFEPPPVPFYQSFSSLNVYAYCLFCKSVSVRDSKASTII